VKRFCMAAMTALCLLSTSAPVLASEWTQMRYDSAQSSVNDDETAVGVGNVGTGSIRWTRKPPARTAFLTAPIVTETAVVVGGFKTLVDGSPRSMLWSYDLGSGSLNWKRMLACTTVNGPSMALDLGLLVVVQNGCPWVADDGDLGQGVTLVDIATGKVRKTIRFDDRVDAPTIYGHTVVVDTSLDGDTVALINLQTRRRSGSVPIYEGFASTGIEQPFVVHEGEIYVAGDERWGSPVVSDDLVLSTSDLATGYPLDGGNIRGFYRCETGYLCGFDNETHERLWIKPTTNLNEPMMVGDVMYAVTRWEEMFSPNSPSAVVQGLCAYDAATGQKQWCSVFDEARFGDVRLSAFDTSGWRPIYANGVIYLGAFDVAAADNVVLAFDSSTGEPLARLHGGKYMAIANGRLVTSAPSIRVTTFGGG